MRKAVKEVAPLAFNESQVGWGFDYEAHLRLQAKQAALAIAGANPSPVMHYLDHPKEPFRYEQSVYQQIGEVYVRKAFPVPLRVLEEFDRNEALVDRYVVRIERVVLDPHWQRRGFLGMLLQELSAHRFKYVILSQVPNPEFARYLHAACNAEHTSWKLLEDMPRENWQERMPSFIVKLN